MNETLALPVDCPTEHAILHTLAYFEIFRYPLRAQEIHAYCPEPEVSPGAVREKLVSLTRQGLVFQLGEFFSTQNKPEWATDRLENNRRADRFLPLARRIGRFISRFPFVRGVCVSGSLSKHSMRPDSDVDFFIITRPRRLWLARTLLMVFKKMFLLNSHKYFCINYLIDTEHLEIEEKNLFTATETVTLLPMNGKEYYQAFCMANRWAWEQYPNFPPRSTADIPPHRAPLLKRFLEKIFSGRLGDWLDRRCMRITMHYWQKKFQHLDAEVFAVALKSRRYVSKHHPLHFQHKVLHRFEERMREIISNKQNR